MTTETKTDDQILLPESACDEAREWVSATKGSPRTLWERCPRGDWLLWLVATVGVDRKLVVHAACDCARLALVHVPAGEERPRLAIETAERWSRRGKATIEEVRADAYDAYDAADAYDATAAYAAAARAAADAARAARAAARAAYASGDSADAYAAAAAAYAADAARAACAVSADLDDAYAVAAAARSATLRQCAALVRARIPWPHVERVLRGAQ